MTASMPTMRLATLADRAALHRMLHETDLHYWGAAAPSFADMARHVDEHVLSPESGCEFAIAEFDGQPAGYASFAIVYPAPKLTGQLFMKDLFVMPKWRKQGVGVSLMRYLAGLAISRGCSRFDWTAEHSNPKALAFYDRLGAQRVADKVYYRLDGDGLAAMAGAAAGRQPD